MRSPTGWTAFSGEAAGFSVLHLPSVGSTSDYVIQHADSLPHATVVVADRQHAGRGQQGRTWHSPLGNAYMTVLLKELSAPLRERGAGILTLLMAEAVCRAVELRGIVARMKWPNDVLCGGRKLAGVLAEGAWEDGGLAWAALGVGVNLNMSLEDAGKIDRPVAVLADELGQPVDRTRFVLDVLRSLRALLDIHAREGADGVLRQLVRRLEAVGEVVSVAAPGGEQRGIVKGLDDDGALLLDDADGITQRIVTGVMTC